VVRWVNGSCIKTWCMPSTRAERHALAVVAAIAALGVVARVVRSKTARPAPTAAEVLALDAQIERVREARKEGRSGRSGSRPNSSARQRISPSTSGRASQTPREVKARERVDLDTAGLTSIEGLPWIGPSLAARILESREKCGPFGSLQALTRVYGIGEGMAKRLEPHVTFSTSSSPMDAARTEGCSKSAKGAAPRRRGRS
jgi:DNA uptake protein ComE-like DNA-binding protein